MCVCIYIQYLYILFYTHTHTHMFKSFHGSLLACLSLQFWLRPYSLQVVLQICHLEGDKMRKYFPSPCTYTTHPGLSHSGGGMAGSVFSLHLPIVTPFSMVSFGPAAQLSLSLPQSLFHTSIIPFSQLGQRMFPKRTSSSFQDKYGSRPLGSGTHGQALSLFCL